MITVTKSSPVVVVPSTSPATRTTVEQIKLSPFDKPLAFFPFTSFLIFNNAIHEPAETIKNALSRALIPYFPIAGRAAIDAGDGELRISCTGEGVSFVSASANCSLDDVKLFHPPFSELLGELAVDYPDATCRRPSDPLLLMQVTEFSGGGFVVGTTWDHGIADGTGMAQFLQAVGDLARGLPQPTIFPVSCGDDGWLPELPPSVTAVEKAMVALEPQGFVYQDITVPWKVVNRVKAEFAAGGHGDGKPCTVFEAVIAVLWRCRARVVVPDADAPAPLVFAVNARRHVGAKDGYFGNCVTSAVSVPRSGDVANGSIGDVVRLIRRAKEGIPGRFVGGTTVAGEEGSATEKPQLDVLFGYNAFFVSSWRNLGFDVADFGGGRPARVMCPVALTSVPNCVACLPCAANDGASVLARCVTEEHADALLRELEMF
ncbi:unnamed protein product [Urochloa decumbens]|uniref:Uncharacterized protein n=1 Tax=Urochloa decumbens TaxID=240449 RepID=A0ABC9CBJ7_9POAL